MRVAPGSGRAPRRPLDVSKPCHKVHKLRICHRLRSVVFLMQLQVGGRFSDEFGEWEATGRVDKPEVKGRQWTLAAPRSSPTAPRSLVWAATAR